MPALHAPRPGVLAHRRRALRRRVRRRDHRLDRRQPAVVRRELGLRDGRRAAGRQLDLGLPLLRAVAAPAAIARSAAASCARCSCTASSSSSTSRRPISTATTTCATASGSCFSAASSGAPDRAGALARARPRPSSSRRSSSRRRPTASTSSSPRRITGWCSKRFSRATSCCAGTARTCRPRAGAARADVRVRPGVHQAGRPRAAHRRRRRRPDPDPGHAGDRRSPVPARRTPPSCSAAADFKASAGRCWEETFWLLGADAPRAFRALTADARRPGRRRFADGGFYVLRGAETHLVVDCGEVGMRGRGGHGHNDILSFELFLNGFNVVTDCGAYLYTASREWRNLFRSTAFHNTVQVDDEELNRFVGPDALWQLHYDAKPVDAVMRVGERVRLLSRRPLRVRTADAARLAHARVLRRQARCRACSFTIGWTGDGDHALDVALPSRSGGRRRSATAATCACPATAGSCGCCPTRPPPRAPSRSSPAGCRRATA